MSCGNRGGSRSYIRNAGIPFIRLLLILSIPFAGSCSSNLERLIPGSLDEKTFQKQKVSGAEAESLFEKDSRLGALLSEFKPADIHGAVYHQNGITIQFGIARFLNGDEAYGLYSGLVDIPRERWELDTGEISYKSPYVSGHTGSYAFWFFSPSMPESYFNFYRTYGEHLLQELKGSAFASDLRSYHWKILPRENRYINSLFYIKSRRLKDLEFRNTYGAQYQAGRNVSRMYVQELNSEEDAYSLYQAYAGELKNNKKDIRLFPNIAGGRGIGICWKDASGYTVIYLYRWLIIMVADVPDLRFAQNFIRNSFMNMMRIRDEVLGNDRKKRG